MSYTKRTWAEIDISALKHNLDYIKFHTKDAEIMAVVKADSYGHNVLFTAPFYDKSGVDSFAVSNIDEAIQLRKIGINKPILVLGYTPVENAKELADYDIVTALYSSEYAELLSKEATRINRDIKVFIKLDTGMGRIGFNCREDSLPGIEDAAKAASLPHIVPVGVFAHFAVADRNPDSDDGFTDRQYSRFCSARKALEDKGFKLKYSCCNSAAILNDSDKISGICRPGIILYGLSPDNSLGRYPELIPVMTLKTVVSSVKPLKRGETVSYGRTFTANKDMTVATLAAGYADGYNRLLSNKGFVFAKGKKMPIIGRICMDQMIIDSTGTDLKIGDEVELFGKNILVSSLADIIGTINYELVCDVSKRVPRIAVNGEEK